MKFHGGQEDMLSSVISKNVLERPNRFDLDLALIWDLDDIDGLLTGDMEDRVIPYHHRSSFYMIWKIIIS